MKNRGAVIAAIVLGVLLVVASLASAATTTVNLAWDANTEVDLAGYKLYQATQVSGVCGTFTVVQPTILKPATTTSVTGLVDGAYCWKLTAYDTVNNESGFSNTVTFSSDTTPPAAPRATLRVVSTVVVP